MHDPFTTGGGCGEFPQVVLSAHVDYTTATLFSIADTAACLPSSK